MSTVFLLCAAVTGALVSLAIQSWRPARQRSKDALAMRERLSRLGDRLRSQEPEEQAAAAKQLLAAAGFRDDEAINLYQAARLLSVIFGVVLGLVLWPIFQSPLAFFGVAAAGFLLPNFLLRQRAKTRRRAIERGLPETVDLLVNCIDAGLGFEQALERVTVELGHSQPIIAEEFQVVVHEFATAIPIGETMRRLSRRVGLEDLDTMCAVIAQASELGAPMSQSLREYTAAARRKRIASLDEEVGKVTAQMTFPLLLCLIPASLLVVVGPTIITLVEFFSGGME